jgi:hypothetical protein
MYSYSDFETNRHDRPSKEERLSFQKRAIRRELRRQHLRDLRSLTLKDTMQNTLQAGQASEHYTGNAGELDASEVDDHTDPMVIVPTTFVGEVANEQQPEPLSR